MIINGIRNSALHKRLRRLHAIAGTILKQPALQEGRGESTATGYTAGAFTEDMEMLSQITEPAAISCTTVDTFTNIPLPDIEKNLSRLLKAFEDNAIANTAQLENLLGQEPYTQLSAQMQNLRQRIIPDLPGKS